MKTQTVKNASGIRKTSSLDRRRENRRRENRRRFFSRLPAYILIFAFFYAIISVSYLAVIGIKLLPGHSAKPKETIVKIEIAPKSSSNKNGTYKKYISQFMTPDGKPYLPIIAINPFSEMTVTGSGKIRSFIFYSGEYANFSDGDINAVVNGTNISLSAPCHIMNGEVYLPVDFYTTDIIGISLEIDKNGYYILRKTADKLEYTQKTASVEASIPLTSEISGNTKPGRPDDFSDPVPKPDFISNLSDYEKYMNPENRDDYLILVNSTHSVSNDYKPSDLTDIADTRKDRDAQQMCLVAEKALEALYIEMRANGFTDVSVTSGYRSYYTQEYLFNNSVNSIMSRDGCSEAEAKKKAAVGTAPPGTSEHQTGLCCDMHNLDTAKQSFADEAAAKWLAENAHKFGFILRYQKDKQDITGIMFEPWHFRYVGRYHATKMYEYKMCLEEYLAKYKNS
ncbi:MAG: M15 family metallopeptidase [Oscillospiraceae bacterium]|nr:M15 family metallopeptidase [Oscillospiraceae bacterium]